MSFAVLKGTVTDTVQGALPGAKVEARGVDSKAIYETLTNAKGEYEFSALPEGSYDITAQSPGFVIHRRRGLYLHAGQNQSYDFTLELNLGEYDIVSEVVACGGGF